MDNIVARVKSDVIRQNVLQNHPRIFITAGRISAFRARYFPKNVPLVLKLHVRVSLNMYIKFKLSLEAHQSVRIG